MLSDEINIINIINNCYLQNQNIKHHMETIFGKFIFDICIDENDDIMYINTGMLLENIDNSNIYYDIVKRSPNILLDKNSGAIILQFFDRANVVENNIKNDMHNTKIYPIFAGSDIYILFYNGELIAIYNSKIIDDKNMFQYKDIDILLKQINIDSIDKRYCYRFLIRTNSEHMFDKILFPNKKSFLARVYELNTSIEVDTSLFNIENIYNIQECIFGSYCDIINKINDVSTLNRNKKRITFIGYNINVYNNGVCIGQCNMYNKVYQNIKKNIDKNNIYQVYLELYQKNKLMDVLPYISKYSQEIRCRLNMSMKTISKEILNIYHMTRKKKEKEIYVELPELYKKILYELHGIYISTRKHEIFENKDIEYDETKSISVYDVYHHIKNLTYENLLKIFRERYILIKTDTLKYLFNTECIYTLIQSKLMFPEI